MEMLAVLDHCDDANEEKEESIERMKEDFISMKGGLGNLIFLKEKVSEK